MIEIGNSAGFRMSYEDAVLYCFSLGDGWRMPTHSEFVEISAIVWYENDSLRYAPCKYTIIPVRDIEPTIFNRLLCIFHPRYFRVKKDD